MFTRALLRAGDVVFVLRPLIMIPAWSIYVLGAHAAGRYPRAEPTANEWAPGFICLTAVLAGAYVVNQVFDVESDRLNGKGHYLTRGIFPARTMVMIAFLCLVAAGVVAFFVAPAQRLPLALAAVLSLAYSMPPLRLCARPIADVAANAVGYGGIAFAVGYAAVAPDWTVGFARAVPWMFLVAATFLHTTILDRDGDAAAGKRTTTVAIGVGQSAKVAMVASIVAAVWAQVSLWRGPGFVSEGMVTIFSVPVFIAARVPLRLLGLGEGDPSRASSLAVQIITALVALAAAIQEPVLFVLILPLIGLARLYYAARFGVRYPGRA